MEKVRVDFRDQIASNKRKSVFLMLSVIVFIVLLGWAISNAFSPEYFTIIMIIASLISILYVVISYYNSHKISIAAVGAKPARQSEYKDYHNLVEGLTLASGLPKPKLYIMPSRQINAFASGRNPQNAVVCVTEGALEKLDRRELEGVLAHELGHIGNYDMRYMTTVAVLVGMVSIISQIFLRSLFFGGGGGGRDDSRARMIFMLIGVLLAILAPIAVYFVQMSISRKREYSADATAVKFTRYPQGLIGALKKIKSDYQFDQGRMHKKKPSKALAPLFFANPMSAFGSTHPPLEKRIKALERM